MPRTPAPALAAAATLAVASLAHAAPVDAPFTESFDDATTPVDLRFNDFNGNATNAGDGTAPGFTIRDGGLVFFDNSDGGDVGAAVVQPNGTGDATSFSVSASVAVQSSDFTLTTNGVVAYAPGPQGFGREFAGLQAFVQETDTTGNAYQFVLANGNTTLATSGGFDLTDGSPDFTVSLAGTFDADRNVALTATLVDAGGQNNQTLTGTVAAGAFPVGNDFGVRIQPGFNTYRVTFDDLTVTLNAATPIPEPASLGAVGVLAGLTVLRRRTR